MIIVLIHWKIAKGRETEFLADWETRFTIKNRDGMVAEYMSAVKSRADHPYITWPIGCDDPKNERACAHFINVSIWDSAERFNDEVARHFNDTNPPLSYEVERRRRVVIDPLASRRGPAELAKGDVSAVR
jgi:heme-degrading monooxygenase HmoA